MKKKTAFDDKLARIGEIERERPAGAAAELEGLLASKESYLVGRAAEAAAELGLSALTAALAAAFKRLAGGEQLDRGCLGAVAVIRALARLEAEVPECYLLGLRMVRREPSGPGFVDRATVVRIESALALVRTGHRRALVEVAPLLADPEAEVRAGAAQAIGAIGGDGAAAVLHLKLLSGDGDPEVLGACMTGLLHADAARYLPIIAAALDGDDERLAEVAALSLGDSRAEGALDALSRALRSAPSDRLESTLLLGLGLLRSDAATARLFEVLAEAREATAIRALDALALQKQVASVRERAASIVAGRKSRRLDEALRQKLGT
ncbi:MAG: hypothetical protein U0359_12075 [Byssovorax sp.]